MQDDFRRVTEQLDMLTERLSTICLILEDVIKYLPKNQASQMEITSNTLLKFMDGLAHEITIKIRGHQDLPYQNHPEFEDRMIAGWPAGRNVEVKIYDDPEYQTTFYLTRPYDAPRAKRQRLEFIVTSAELHTIFNRYCANQHVKNAYENSTSLGSRIANDHKVMEKSGWEYVRGVNPDKLTYKRKGGYNYWRFSKEINAIDC